MSDEPRFEPAIVPPDRPGKAGGVRQKNRLKRTDALCKAALGLFLESGLEGTTVDEITRAAGVSKGSFYRYFPDKAGLVRTLVSPTAEAVTAALTRCRDALHEADSGASLEAAYAALALDVSVILLGQPDLVRFYLQESRAPATPAREPLLELQRALMEGTVELTVVAHARGLLRDLPPRVTAGVVVGAIESLLMEHFRGAPVGNPTETTAALIALVLGGIRKS